MATPGTGILPVTGNRNPRYPSPRVHGLNVYLRTAWAALVDVARTTPATRRPRRSRRSGTCRAACAPPGTAGRPRRCSSSTPATAPPPSLTGWPAAPSTSWSGSLPARCSTPTPSPGKAGTAVPPAAGPRCTAWSPRTSPRTPGTGRGAARGPCSRTPSPTRSSPCRAPRSTAPSAPGPGTASTPSFTATAAGSPDGRNCPSCAAPSSTSRSSACPTDATRTAPCGCGTPARPPVPGRALARLPRPVRHRARLQAPQGHPRPHRRESPPPRPGRPLGPAPHGRARPLLLARPLAADLRRPWEKHPDPARPLPPGRVRRGFRNIRRSLGTPAHVAKPSRPGPGRPKGSSKGPAPRHLLPGEADKPRTANTTLTSQKVKT